MKGELLRWARESAGLSVEEVARRLKREPAEIAAWEQETSSPTYVQLESLAYDVFKRPLAVFFLPQPPVEPDTTREFRTLPDVDVQSLSAHTRALIRQTLAYQISLTELFAAGNPSTHQICKDLTLSTRRSIEEQADQIRQYLRVTLPIQSAWTSDDDALRRWRSLLEDAGIFVFKSAFKQEEISGLCLRHAEFPLILVNNSTTKTRQVFSLLHELAHLLFQVSGISKYDAEYVDRLPTTARSIERFCNQVAAEVLVPSADFAQQLRKFPSDMESLSDVAWAQLADRYRVSRESILRRALDLGRVGSVYYQSKADLWRSQQKEGSGGNWYSTTAAYLSERFAREVFGRYFRHQLSAEQAADLLGVKVKNLAGLEDRVLHGVA